MHDASSLAVQGVESWRNGVLSLAEPPAAGRLVPPAPAVKNDPPGATIEAVIERRGSTRRFARKPISLSDLSTMLDRATRGIPIDCLDRDAQLNDLYLIVNRVEGLDSGAYLYRRDERAIELIKPGDFSEKASYLTLEQELGGDASVTIFFMADLNSVLQTFGNRGYRAAQLEAGIIGGKIYLAAYAIGRGATGLTFFDDDVTEFFSPHAAGKSCTLVVSVGVPGKRLIY
jgi:SagB-type dehydrogenase family enzyme